MKLTYEELITDIIHSLHDLKRLTPQEVLAIYETAKYDVNIPRESLYGEYERRLYQYNKCKKLVLGYQMVDKECYLTTLSDKEETVT